ncbi:acetyltransferase [Thermaerobacillus caldiproteolyticus]|uniref:acetyltransferase n=1 Tax=Thermaerobacillus caldiproteolyticus TaxID=247480 RepID=UPI0018F1A10E|nr:acetyltransferase [Anoxybacillus caldiproteolyticus]
MCSKPVIIIGNGGHARVLVDILSMQKREIIGYTAPNKENNPYSITYLGGDEKILKYDPREIELVNAIGSVSDTKPRANIFNFFKLKGYSFSTIIHPSAVISETVTLGEGVQVMAGVVIQPFAKIDDNTIVNTSTSIDHDCCISKHCHIAPGCVLSGGVFVGEGTHIGTGTKIIQNVTVGKNVLVGAGSLVLRSVGDNKKIYGSPAKEVSK